MKYKFLIAFIIALATLTASGNDFYPEKKAVSHIKKALKIKDIVITGELDIPDELISTDATIIYQFKNGSDNNMYYAVFKETKGRHDKFDYLLIANNESVVLKVAVVRYRSEYGGEIGSRKWLSQFIDFKGGSLQYGKDVSAISGATVSAKAIVKDIPLTLEVFKKSLAAQ